MMNINYRFYRLRINMKLFNKLEAFQSADALWADFISHGSSYLITIHSEEAGFQLETLSNREPHAIDRILNIRNIVNPLVRV